MKKIYLLAIILALTLISQAGAEENTLGVTFDVTYVSQYISKGASAYGKQAGIFETLDFDFYGSGFGLKVKHRNSGSSGYVDSQRFDYRPYYKSVALEGSQYQTNYNISVGYEYYYGLTRTKANTTHEWIGSFAWPKLLGNGLVPKYIVHYETPVSGGDINRKVAGWVHRFILGKNLAVAALANPLHASAEIAYYDGLGNKGHDWAYFTGGLSTKFKLAEDLTLAPGIYYQISMEDSVNTNNDILYTQISMKYKF